MSDDDTIQQRSTEHAGGGAGSAGSGPRLGLAIPGTRGLRTADGLPAWLLATAARSGVALDVVDLEGGRPGARDRDGYVLLAGQYGPAPAPATEDLVTRSAARWAGRPVGLVAYGGVSRGRDAAARIRTMLAELDALVVETGMGVNVAQLRGGGPSAFERVAWAMVLDAVVATCVRPTAAS